MHNHAIPKNTFAYATGRTRRHVRGDDLDNVVTDACSLISKAVLSLIDNTHFSEPFVYWLLPNYQVVVGIGKKDLK